MQTPSSSAQYRSKLSIYNLRARESRIVFEVEGVLEAPNWSRDGQYLLVNMAGGLFRLALPAADALTAITLQPGTYSCNNDHDLSPNGRALAFSASTPDTPQSRVFVSDADGRDVRLLTPNAPSYFHGWSADGKWLAFVAERGDGKFELYRVPALGGEEQRLTTAGGYDDGPEYSPDAGWIYFNSNRSGNFSIWRIPFAGAGPGDTLAERVTFGPTEDWFPHISPDGRWLVFLSFPAGTIGHDDKLPGMQLWLLPLPGAQVEACEPELLAEFFGGQGTFNVNSWSPDSSEFAYVIYEPIHHGAR